MFKKILLTPIVFFHIICFSQNLTGEELINKSIEYHDPNNNWTMFAGDLNITMETPSREPRVSTISLNLPKQYFKNEYGKDGNTITQEVNKETCIVLLNKKKEFTAEEEKTYRLSCDQAKRTRDYYTYLYGLPMKLKDPGTLINPKVEKRSFKGKEYWVAQVKYEKEVGKDTWYFYFDPSTFALEVYQFYHDESKNDGEYILLTEESEVNGIKMPKNRAWFYNKDDAYLGTDFLYKNKTK
ncbi:MAG: DUF6503 family protein [Flavobacteriaceae bacterium]|nr:DUF6503 family protein [Flavobacteriaceae bacterium]